MTISKQINIEESILFHYTGIRNGIIVPILLTTFLSNLVKLMIDNDCLRIKGQSDAGI
jgi:hypothetical protein